ncbi:hypothetical protein SCHAM137S_07998 [Streptomyces chartreusis]
MRGREQRADRGFDARLFVVRRYEHRHRGVDLLQPGRAGAEARQAPDVGAGEHSQHHKPQHAQPTQGEQHPGHGVRERVPGVRGPDQRLSLPSLGCGHLRVGRGRTERVRDGGEAVDMRVGEEFLRLLVRQVRLTELADHAVLRITVGPVRGDQHIAVRGNAAGCRPLGAAQRVHLGGQRHPQQSGPNARRTGEGFLGERQLHRGAHARGGTEVRAGVGVRADLVALVEDPPHQLRMACRLRSVQEEGRARVMPAQQVEEARGPVGIRAAVVGERDGTRGHGRGLDVDVSTDVAQHRTALVHGLRPGPGAGEPRLGGVDLMDGPALEEQGGEDGGQGEGQQPPVTAWLAGTGVAAAYRAAHTTLLGVTLITAETEVVRQGPGTAVGAPSMRRTGVSDSRP